MRSVLLAAGIVVYTVGALAALVVLIAVARADTSIVRADSAAAPALQLGSGVYDLVVPEGAPGPEVFALMTRDRLRLRAEGSTSSFEVGAPGIYVIQFPEGGSLRSRERFVLSPTLFFAIFVAPLATLPGVALVDRATPLTKRDVVLGGSPFRLASVGRRLGCVVLDFIAIAAMLILLALLTPLLVPIGPFVPFAPAAYIWTGNARGQTIGRWLGGTRIVTIEGGAPGWWAGLLRSVAFLLGWCLLGGGYLAAALHPSRTAPHDRLAQTRVVHD